MDCKEDEKMNEVLCGGRTYGDDGMVYDVFFSESSDTTVTEYSESSNYEIVWDEVLQCNVFRLKGEPKRCPHCGEIIEE